MAIIYRPIKDDEFAAFLEVEFSAYSGRADGSGVKKYREVTEFDRAISAFDNDQIVGTIASFGLEMAIPGGSAPTGALSFVSARPTHRRRGILTKLMGEHLELIRDRGEAFASLHASESSIYGRFGYGIASTSELFEISRADVVFRDEIEPAGSVDLLTEEQAKSEFPEIYREHQAGRPGVYDRDDRYWRLRFWPDDVKSSLFAVYREDGRALGYVIYRGIENWENWTSRNQLVVQELVTNSTAAHRALWEYLLSLDVIESIRAANRPVDDPLRWMLAVPRRLRRSQVDSLWVRIVDVPKALEARRYGVDGGLVIEVVDEFGGLAGGRFKLDGGPLGATCVSTVEDADIALSVDALGAMYLGGVKPSVLAAAGRVAEGSPAALATADAMFGWAVAPWCPAVEPLI